ncbi:hypothetical protein COCMIDRAFT_102020 [Bipolaris oryzae ATCC 44560]|uniref:DUF6594 domain-containing protein n=1 Tax=Bipolaris oryzae ATCC 44560 TaxID=930090 RepID=W6Z609_COCMI|nr:uncharacterized protein COCMIDRAFT_102020 [Bipolaris oryzae ATCC 44560]EUC42999.1 hypothetical protein COCMIDRAFT_102020 [Bipolaris oryzae ATCC 44560]
MLEAGLIRTSVYEKTTDAPQQGQEMSPVFGRSWDTYPGGYPMLAERIALKPQTAIYRRFDALNSRRILYLQAELCSLESRLRKMEEQEDQENKRDKRRFTEFAVDYNCMLKAKDGEGKPHLELLERIGEKLSQYNEALLQVSNLSQIPAPQKFDLADIQHFLDSKAMESNLLNGIDSPTWGSCDKSGDHAPDLVGVHPRPKADDFSRWIAEESVRLFSCGLGRLTKGTPGLGRKVYYDSQILKITSWLTCILASLLPIASILVLLNVPSLKGRLWVIAAFNILMSVCLRTFTEAKKSEAFAITAA